MTLRSLAINVALAVVYSDVFIWCYTSFLNYEFGYAGFELYPKSALFMAASVILAVLPTLAYRGTRAISSVISVLIYLILYVPIILTLALGSIMPERTITIAQALFAAGMTLLFLSDGIIVKNPIDLRTSVNLMPWVLGATALSTAYIVFIYRGNLSFAAFGDAVYTQRFANMALGSGLVTRYLSSWLATVFIPLCLAYALMARKYWYFAVAGTACLIMYMATADKIVILFPAVYIGFYALLKARIRLIYPLVTVSLIAMIAGLLSVAGMSGAALLAASIILNRTIGNGGQITALYLEFFSFHPQTDYSHVMGIRELVHQYPYGSLGVGQVIGQFYWDPYMNANANFWATDGIAALGLPGVAVASIGCALLFALMNSITRGYNKLFVLLCFIPFISTLLNQSMFSAVWSGGAFFILLFFLLNGRNEILMSSDGPQPAHAR